MPNQSLLPRQSPKRREQIFKNSLKYHESAAGIFVQRVSGADLWRIMKPVITARKQALADASRIANRREREEAEDAAYNLDARTFRPDTDDVLVNAIYDFDETFANCRTKRMDMLSSVESIALEAHDEGVRGNGCLLLAWKTGFDAQRRSVAAPELVGAVTLFRFKSSANFSTDARSLSERDHAILHGTDAALGGSRDTRNYFNRETMYIDGLCAKGRGGVGRLLVLHAIRWALMRSCTGLIAMSYSSQNRRPESYSIFAGLGFEAIIPTARYDVPNMYGTWFYKNLRGSGAIPALAPLDICSRTGYTQKTEDTLVWRCPN